MPDVSLPDQPQLNLAFPVGPVSYRAPWALLPDGWTRDVRIAVDGAGTILAVERGGAPGLEERLRGPVLPGMPNLHSHAFQRALAGLGERADTAGDVWGWRELVHRCLARLGPDEIEAVAAQLFIDMLKQGYTAVGEFHTVHHGPKGRRYADHAEMSERLIAAARLAGIGLTLLPSLYTQGGFGGAPPSDGQRRFLTDPESVLRLVTTLRQRHGDDPQLRFGAAPHSLRAVAPEQLAELVAGLQAEDDMAPIHIQAAEQPDEVEECRAWCGMRPVEYLLSETPVDGRWCVVHPLQLTEAETRALAASDAVAGLCPSAEANLGNGGFPLKGWLAAGGKLGVGSDSALSVSPAEELRWLEYQQRQSQRLRGVAAAPDQPSTGTALWSAALEGGAQALGRPVGRLEPGFRADLLVLDADDPALADRPTAALIDCLIFVGGAGPVRDVMVGGRWVVRDRHHAAEEAILDSYRRALRALREDT